MCSVYHVVHINYYDRTLYQIEECSVYGGGIFFFFNIKGKLKIDQNMWACPDSVAGATFQLIAQRFAVCTSGESTQILEN